ncbi:MAG: 16S rRNA (adenine(1518)-N(6)/adenine(1519)-N(6))-dimethyltransferase RsmA [Candidatus Methanofastidiosia archaeon]
MKSKALKLLKKYNLYPSRRLSQNFLIDERVIEKMASYAHGTVLEIGSGLGFITEKLSEKAERVIAIEKDLRLLKILKSEYDFSNVEFICGDFMKLEVPDFDVSISNIPYSLSSQITFKLLKCNFEFSILSYQREFAERMVVQSGLNYSRLSVMTQILSDAELLEVVPRKAFYPKPKTDSALLKLIPNKKFEVDEFFENVVRALFSHKRKKVRNSLYASRYLFKVEKDEMKRILKDMKYGDRKVYSLKLSEIKEISDDLRKLL